MMPTLDATLRTMPETPRNIKNHRISIEEVLSGFIVEVGCQTVVFESKEKMLSELARYLDNRSAVEREYLDRLKQIPA